MKDEVIERLNLQAMEPMKRAAFAAACAERLLPNYAAFSRQTGWGNPGLLRAALDRVWEELSKASASAGDLLVLADQCEIVVPDTEAFDTPLVSAALDAAVSVIETIRAVVDPVPEHAAAAAICARDTVDMYIQELENLDPADPELETKISGHRLMASELSRQIEDMRTLTTAEALGPSLIARVRKASVGDGSSNIGLRA